MPHQVVLALAEPARPERDVRHLEPGASEGALRPDVRRAGSAHLVGREDRAGHQSHADSEQCAPAQEFATVDAVACALGHRSSTTRVRRFVNRTPAPTLGARAPLRQTIRRSRRLCARGCGARFFPSLPTSITATSSSPRQTTSIPTAPTSAPTTHPSCDSPDCDGQRAPFYAL